ncbi:carboxymuconolactone decarboxylase family protein [Actinoplanes sp. G11-F43]|uniref:carboxymuconolactone decarboxylase family protein n=1 Tax=Actinoplanes sp. G11-F43 TaxID=3424130 RepID=UPI003D353F25
MAGLFARATRGITLAQIRHVAPVRPNAATGAVATVYARMEREFGMLAPPVALHAADPGLLAAAWLLVRETLLTDGEPPRADREVVAAAVSLANRCPYCVEIHGAALSGLIRHPDAAAVAAGDWAAVHDPGRAATARWATGTGPAPPGPGHDRRTGVAFTFHYLNRMVNVFLPPTPLPAVPPAALGGARRAAASVLGRFARYRPAPGTDLDLLPAATLPADLGWAGAGALGQALARAGAAIERAGARALPAEVRELVRGQARAPGPGLTALGAGPVVASLLRPVPAGERAAARLALLTAVASWRVDDTVVGAVRDEGVTDPDLLAIVAWAAYTAARVAVREPLPGRQQPER